MTRRYFATASSMRFASRARSASSISVRATSGTSSCARAIGTAIVNAITTAASTERIRSDLRHRRGDRTEDTEAVRVAEQFLGAPLRMRHHPEHVPPRVADPGDVPRRSVRIRLARDAPLGIAIAKNDLPIALEIIERGVVREVVALSMRDRHTQHGAALQLARERRVGLFDAQKNIAADESQMLVPHQRARQQTGLGEHLKSIADA